VHDLGVLLALAIVGLFVLPEPWGLILLPIAALIEAGEVYLWIRFLRRYRVTTGAEGLIGERAEVIQECAPVGRVRVHGEIWNARCEGGAGRGESARITAVDGLTLVVEPESLRGNPTDTSGAA
jgi:membrane protein implicated in regulation of membrane protease activity